MYIYIDTVLYVQLYYNIFAVFFYTIFIIDVFIFLTEFLFDDRDMIVFV